MEAASLDIAKAYRNSPILPSHKKYLCVYWKGGVYVQHIAVEGLATAGGIQGTIVDATVALLKFHNIHPTIKWMDNFIFFWCPSEHVLAPLPPVFQYDLSTILSITEPLGIPWHPISKRAMTSNPIYLMWAFAGTFHQNLFLFPLKNVYAFFPKS